MNFDRESWRKLYVLESIEHRLLPLFTRGLRDYLLRVAADDGTILRDSSDPVSDLCSALAAKSSERKQVRAALDDLLRIGYLTQEKGCVRISKFEEAQRARTPEARRQAAWREAHGKAKTKDGVDFGSVRRLRQLDGDRCSYCEKTMDFRLGNGPDRAQIEHVYPRSRGGSDGEDNLVLACRICNTTKGDRTLAESGLTLRNARVLTLLGDVTSNVTIEETRRDETRKNPPPPSEPERPKRPDPFAASFLPIRPDVLALHADWKRTTGLTAHRLKGPTDYDAVTLAEAIDLHGLPLCRTALSVAMADSMVNGDADDKGKPHKSIGYIFGNGQTFARLVQAAESRTKKLHGYGVGALERAMTAEPDTSDVYVPTRSPQ